MEHVTRHKLSNDAARPAVAPAFTAAARAFGRLGLWLARSASDPVGDRLERQLQRDAQMLRRYDRRPAR
jgi:hypothetical protein